MSAAIWFWIIYVVCLVFHGYGEMSAPNGWGWPRSVVFFVLIGLLGWGIFGPPIRQDEIA